MAITDKTKVTLQVTVDLKKYADKVITTEDELREYFTYEYGEGWDKDKDEWTMKRFNRSLRAIKDGKKVMFGSFSSDGEEPIEQYLCEAGLPKSPDMDIIDSSGGY